MMHAGRKKKIEDEKKFKINVYLKLTFNLAAEKQARL